MHDYLKPAQEKLCILAGASEIISEDFFFYMNKWNEEGKQTLLIAVDAGYAFLQSHDIEPDMVVGDFDSLGSVPEHRRVIRHPIRKDDTDMLLAIQEGEREGCRLFAVFGGLGGSPDHSLANIQLLSRLAKRGEQGILFGETMHMTALKNGTLTFSGQFQGRLSVFAVSEKAEGVTLKGFLYEVHDDVLTRSCPIGVSNEFAGHEGVVRVGDGELLVMWQRENHALPRIL